MVLSFSLVVIQLFKLKQRCRKYLHRKQGETFVDKIQDTSTPFNEEHQRLENVSISESNLQTLESAGFTYETII